MNSFIKKFSFKAGIKAKAIAQSNREKIPKAGGKPSKERFQLFVKNHNKLMRKFGYSRSTSQKQLMDAIKLIPKNYDIVECIRYHSVLSLGQDNGRFRFQLVEIDRFSFCIRWSAIQKNTDKLYSVLSRFRDGLSVDSVVAWYDDSARFKFDRKQNRPHKAKSKNQVAKAPNADIDAYRQYAQILTQERQKAEENLAREKADWEALIRKERLKWEQKLREVETAAKSDSQPPIKDRLYYLAVLGAKQNSSPAEIKSIYRKRALEYHPDRVACLGDKLRRLADDEMKLLNEAYRFLNHCA